MWLGKNCVLVSIQNVCVCTVLMSIIPVTISGQLYPSGSAVYWKASKHNPASNKFNPMIMMTTLATVRRWFSYSGMCLPFHSFEIVRSNDWDHTPWCIKQHRMYNCGKFHPSSLLPSSLIKEGTLVFVGSSSNSLQM